MTKIRTFPTSEKIENVLSRLPPREVSGFIRDAIIEKIKSPFKGIKSLVDKRKAIAQSSKAIIDGEKLVSDTTKGLENVSPVDEEGVRKYLSKAVEKYGGKKLTADQAVDLYTQVNKSFTASGKAGKSAKAAFNLALRDSLRSQMPKEIIQATDQIARRYGLIKIGKKLLFPLSIAAGTALGMKILGKATGGAVGTPEY